MDIKRLFIVMFVMLMLVGTVSALDWDNVKDYDKENQVITITNAFGLGETLVRMQLMTPLENKVGFGNNIQVALIKIHEFKSMEGAITGTNTYDLNNYMAPIDREITMKYRVTEEIEFNVYNQEGEVVGTRIDESYSWIEFNDVTELPERNNLFIGLYADVKNGDHVEWIPNKWYGERIDEWAFWTAGLDAQLIAYYDCDETAGTVISDKTGNGLDLTASNARMTTTSAVGKLDTACDFTGGTDDMQRTNMETNDNTWAISMWINTSSSNTQIFFDDRANGGNGLELIGKSAGNVEFRDSAGGSDDVDVFGDLDTNTWRHIVIMADGTNASYYVDGVKQGDHAIANSNFLGGGEVFLFGGIRPAGGNAGNDWEGYMDEIAIYNRTLSLAEITLLYSAPVYGNYTAPVDNNPNITLNVPANDTNFTSKNIALNCTGYDDYNLTNVTLYMNGIKNQTFGIGGLQGNESISTSPTFNDNGVYKHRYMYDGDSSTAFSFCSAGGKTAIFYLNWSVDPSTEYVIPYVARTASLVNTSYYNGSSWVLFTPINNPIYNGNYSDGLLRFKFKMHSPDGFTCPEISEIQLIPGNNTAIIFNKTLAWETDYNWTCNATDATGQNGTTETRTFRIELGESDTLTLNKKVIEGVSENYNLSISANDRSSSNATLVWNGTSYVMTLLNSNGTHASYGKALTMPQVAANTNVSVYALYYINDFPFNASTQNVTIQNIQALSIGDSCTGGLSQAMCWDFANATDRSTVTSVNVDYNFRYGITNSSQVTTNGSLTGIDNLCLCVNSTVYNNYSVGYGEIQYDKTGFSDRRNYVFSNRRLSNNTINNTIYLLNTTSSTSFLFTFRDSAYSVWDNIYITLNRWYPDADQYEIVEMAKTDDKGQTVMKVEVEDVDYRVGVYHTNGTLIYLANPIRMACLASPCSYTLTTSTDSGTSSFENLNQLDYSLVYNSTAGVFTLIYNDPSQATENVTLKVYRDTGTSSTLICSDSAVGYTSTLSCNVSAWNGNLRAVGYRATSPELPFVTELVDTLTTVFTSDMGLFIALIFAFLFMLIGTVSPIAMIILTIIALIPAVVFRSIPISIVLILGAMGGIVIHFMKQSR